MNIYSFVVYNIIRKLSDIKKIKNEALNENSK